MNKSVTVSAPKNPASLPSRSAWAKGPPANTSSSSRPQSPASVNVTQPNTPSHSRKPSALGGANAAFKDGVSVPRSIQPSQKPAAGISFGSIAEPQAPLSSSPAAVPPLSTDASQVKSFGSIPATNGTSTTVSKSPSKTADSATPSPAPTSSKPKIDVKSFFRTSNATPAAAPPPQEASPTLQRAVPQNQSLPQSQSQQSQPPPPQQQHGFYSRSTAPPGPPPAQSSSGPPRSPQYSRQMSNGGPSRPPNNAALGPGSPRLSGAPVQHQIAPSQHPGMPPMHPQWSYPYYPYPPIHEPNYPQMYPWQASLPPQMQHPPPPPPHAQAQQPQPPHAAPSPSRPPPPPLHTNGGPPSATPSSSPYTFPHPNPQSPPPPGTPQTPSTARLNTQAAAFYPNKRMSSAIKIRNPDSGEAIDVSTIASPVVGPTDGTPSQAPTPPGHARKTTAVRLETEESRKKRMEEEQREKDRRDREEKDRRERDEQERTAKLHRDVEEKRRKRKEEEERVRREAEERERKKREEEKKERARKEEEERKEKERIRAEEEERLKKEEEERERIRKEEEARKLREEEEARRQREEEEARKQREEEARRLREEEEVRKLRQEEEARKLREEEEAKERVRKAEEEAAAAIAKAKAEAEERLRKEEEVREKERENERDREKAAASIATPSISSTATSSPSPSPSLSSSTAPKSAQADQPKFSKRPIPGPLDLSSTSRAGLPPPLPSALATARAIENLEKIQYPEGVSSPKPELNAGAKNGKFRYDREFLLQFMAVCKEKPDSLPPLDVIGLEPSDQGSIGRSRGSSRTHLGNMPPPPTLPGGRAPLPGIGLGIMGAFGNKGPPASLGTSAGTKITSEDRFAASQMARSASVGAPPGSISFPRPTPMTRTASQGGSTPSQPSSLGPSGRTRSQRGGKRHDSNKVGNVPSGVTERERTSSTLGSSTTGAMGLEPVAPLVASENRWTAQSTMRRGLSSDPDSSETVERKVKSLLNKLTMERFDSISDQIVQWANRSEKEKDGRTLIQVIRLVFEKATDEAAWSEMYARLCRKMMEQISQHVQDDTIRNPEGKPIAGGQLFRKYLLNRCQEDFERGWSVKEASARAAESKAADDKATKDAAEAAKASGKGTGEEVLYSDEYYAAQRAKRQGLGLVKFIGELFKLSMLTERIMHECIKKLLGNVENPEEEEIESLCKLLSTVGQQLDTPKARSHMDVYFQRMKELSKSSNITSRMQYMLMDVLDLRERKWISRNAQAAPTTIAAVHEQAAKDQAKSQLDKDALRNIGRDPMSRSGSRRGEHRGGYGGAQPGPDGWTSVASAPPRPPPTVGDLTQFGKITKSATGVPMTFGPGSVFAKAKDAKREASLSRTSSTSNMFAMLNSEAAAEPIVSAAKSSRPPSRKPSADFTHGGLPEAPPQRKKLVLAPRTIPVPGETKADDNTALSEASEEEPEPVAMTEEQATAKINEDIKEFWSARNLDEAEEYLPALSMSFRARFVEKLVANALERKEADAKLVADLFVRMAEKDTCTAASFEEGFTPHMEFFDDVAIDVPAAYKLMAVMLKGSKLAKSKVEELANKISFDGDPVILPRDKLMKEYEKLDSS